jgi:hypothetical protein
MELEKILEDFYDYFRAPEYTNVKNFPVHKNPSKKEIDEIIKDTEEESARFIADPDKEIVYVFPANILHQYVSDKIYKTKPSILLFGLARKGAGRYLGEFGQAIGSDINDEKYYENILKKDWNWLNKYFDIEPMTSTIFRRYLGK